MSAWSWVALVAAVLNLIAIALYGSLRRRDRGRIETLQRQLATAQGIIGERTDGEPHTFAEAVALLRVQEEISRNLTVKNENLAAENARLRAASLPQLTPLAVDEDVTRPYIPDYEDREQPWTEER